jgi:hypothetical protein
VQHWVQNGSTEHVTQDDTIPPGFEDRVIHDMDSNPKQIFEQESAGVDNHPASDLPHE